MDGYESQRSIMVKVGIFTVTMLLVAFGLVVTFGEFRFGPSNTYHANFIDATRLKGNQKVRIAGVPVGAVKEVKLNPDNTVDVAFSVDKRYTLYSSTRALIRYDNLVGDRFLEITSGPGELRKLPPGGTIDQRHTQPALDLDALLGGLRPVLKGLDADKVNTVSSYVIDLLQGQGGALSNLLANTNSFGSTLGAHDRAIGDVITNLNAVLATVDAKGAQFSDTVDQLQKLITGLAEGRDAIAGAIPPLATTTSDLTDLLKHSRRPLQGTLENLRPLAGELERSTARGEQRHRATRRGLPPAVGARRLRCVLQHLLLHGVAEDQRPGRKRHHSSRWVARWIRAKAGALLSTSSTHRRDRDPLRTGIFGVVLVVCVILVAFGYTTLPFYPQGRPYTAYFADAGGINPGNDVYVSGIKVGRVQAVTLAGDTAKVAFTVDRHVNVGNQSLAAIRTETILGQRAVAVTPAGSGIATTIPLSRTTTPYALGSALEDLGHNAGDLDKAQFEKSLKVLTDALHDATPQLRGALDGITSLSRTLNTRDEALEKLLAHAKSVTGVLAERAGQVNKLIVDGNQLFAALDARRAALAELISGIDDVSAQLSGFVADNRKEFGPALSKLNTVLDDLNERRDYISEALKRLPPYATTLGEVVGSGPGFNVNVYGVIPAPIVGIMFDAVFQPGKLPNSFADYLRGLVQERWKLRPQSP